MQTEGLEPVSNSPSPVSQTWVDPHSEKESPQQNAYQYSTKML